MLLGTYYLEHQILKNGTYKCWSEKLLKTPEFPMLIPMNLKIQITKISACHMGGGGMFKSPGEM